MRATARDVAARAEVSVSTVSRALTGSPDVSDRVRTRVAAVAAEIGYVPHVSSRARDAHPARALGLVVDDAADPYMTALVTGVRKRANSAGYTVAVLDVSADGTGLDRVRDLAAGVEGIVLAAPVHHAELLEAAGRRPSVTVNHPGVDVPGVWLDYGEGVRQALACVKALGHTRVALAGGPSTSDLSARWVAYSTAFARSWTDVDLVDLGGFALDVAGGIAAAGRAVASGATAVCTYHDVIAQGVLEGLRRAGVEVPGRMSVIGAGEPAGSAAIAPALTRVEVPMVDAGRASVDLLISLLRDRATRPAHHWDLDVHLAIRDTTGPLRVLRR